MVPSLFTAGINDEEQQPAGDLFDHDAGGHGVGTLTPVGLGDVHGVEAGLIERIEGFLGESLVLVAIGRVRHDVAFGQCADRGAQFVVFVGQAEQVERGIDGGVMGSPYCQGLWFVQGFSWVSADCAALYPHMPCAPGPGGWPPSRCTCRARPML